VSLEKLKGADMFVLEDGLGFAAVSASGDLFGVANPLFSALRSGPTAGSGAYPKSKFLAAEC
jgi:hypothetical protein